MTQAQASSARLGLRGPAIFLHQQSEPPEILRRLVAQWFYAALECRHEIGRSERAPERLRAALSTLIAFGEWAQAEAAKNGVDFSPIGVSLDDVRAETRLLRDTFRSGFDNCLSESEASQILHEVFG